MYFLSIFLQVLILLSVTANVWSEETCPQAPVSSCADCIKSGPYCAWCKHVNYTKAGDPVATRCSTRADLREKGCLETDIIYPENSYRPVKQKPLTKTDQPGSVDPVQVQPQEVKLDLRPGLPQTIQMKFRRAEGYPVDLYYLMDLSNSMEDDLEALKTLGAQLVQALQEITGGSGKARIGFGTFVDKTVLPFTNTNKEKLKVPCPKKSVRCQPPFGYRHIVSLTNDFDTFNREVAKQNISGNLDTPEGGLDAIMQAAMCELDIGWGNATRLLVLATDAGFHMAGDGKLAAILEPNDGTCHMKHNMYSKSNLLDYPSVGQIAQALQSKRIQPIFAVTSEVTKVYEELTKLIPKSEVGTLSGDSSNVVGLIRDAYNRLSSKIIVTHDSLPDKVKVEYTSPPGCLSGSTTPPPDQGVCEGVKLGQEITFNITVTAEECLSDVAFVVRPSGFNEKLTVGISTRCECECDDPNVENHPHCNDQGEIKCGTCQCNKDFTGQRCECDQTQRDDAALKELCKAPNSTTECEGRGECICGLCECHKNLISGKRYYEKYCQCDDENCNRHNNQLCSGPDQGTCQCGTCKCKAGYEGDSCQCKTSNESCITSKNTICHGRGKCVCDKCVCERGYEVPTHCLSCPSCTKPCTESVKCVECLGFSIGPYKKNCSESCKHLQNKTVERKDDLDHAMLSVCEERDSENCWITFTLEELDGFDTYKVQILKERNCPTPPNIPAIVAGSVAGVALIGLLILLIIKALLYARDLKEWKKFENERRKTKWANADNPLFKEPTTTVMNPTFSGE
ncbi:integrin beta-2-like [Engraulis encrasicolus]|uniref:integrin beta-2-like n=1 Tax=Engraulis encrasicolus TaxID=184585 RepID=UPI002FD72E96